ncbi:efflux transporter outer membrane subunit [Novosphingobium sp. FSY-8]|uniref:Efflux transporter outer membrane subunit n=1 Tax=Novosphingobium ovatum TaxID=1908523 RepID=A0ABW9XBN8_9SPHN|nr:efflux transporter outer membrane subunit [Novosphingobium ovatum]NBC35961.1 efflux transporter outer membrane subunit [Novosphingobium ovatum]
MRGRIACWLVLGAGVLLSGCAGRRDYAPPAALVPPVRALVRAEPAGEGALVPSAQWWEALNDPQLNGLIAQGLLNAPQVAVAQARLQQARAGVLAARADGMPGLRPAAGMLHAQLPEGLGSATFYNLGFDAQWEADIWGGKRQQTRQRRAEAQVAQARVADVQVMLAAEIARSYVLMRGRETVLDLLQKRAEAEQRMLTLAQARLAGGTGTAQGVQAVQAQIAATQGAQAAAMADIVTLRDGLAVLTGQAPGALDGLKPAVIPQAPPQVVTGAVGDILARRPDIRAAERAYAAASAGVGVALARRYPSVSVLGLVGLGGSSPEAMFDTSAGAAAVLPRLTWDFPNFGRVEAGVRAARGGQEAALAQYRQAVLAALQDAEGAVTRFGAARAVASQSADQVSMAGKTMDLELIRAEAGSTSQLAAYEAVVRFLNARITAAGDRAQVSLAYVALAKAMGLGWQAPLDQGAVR